MKDENLRKTQARALETLIEQMGAEKGRVYVSSPDDVPEGYNAQTGEQGGTYYETGGGDPGTPAASDKPGVDGGDDEEPRRDYDFTDFGGVKDYQVSSAQNSMQTNGDKLVNLVEEGKTHPGAAVQAAEEMAEQYEEGEHEDYQASSAYHNLKRGGSDKVKRLVREDKMVEGAAHEAFQRYADELVEAGRNAEPPRRE